MKRNAPYWIGKRPSNGHKWAYTQSAAVIEDVLLKEAILRMHRRYVKQWNDIELDMSRSLSEHTHEVHGAQVVGGGNRRFILHADKSDSQWILEIIFSRGFSEFHPGWSCGKNPFRSLADIQGIHLHWGGEGQTSFHSWLKEELAVNQAKGEATEYKSKQAKQKAFAK